MGRKHSAAMSGLLSWLFGPWKSRRAAEPAVAVPIPAPRARVSDDAVIGHAAVRRVAPGVAFTPTQPKSGRRRVIGREAELRRILQALQDDRAHVVLYSERGRGKTSLSNMVAEALRRTDTVVARHTCEASTTFDSLMRGLMQDLPASLLASREGPSTEGCEAALPPGLLRPRDILGLPQRLACRNVVFLVDEFDRVQDHATRTWLADTIKQISDRGVPLLFLIVGVSENLDQILGQHPSIQRNVLGIHLPLFTDLDVAQLIAQGGRETGLTFLPPTVARITVLARGMPYMAQLLGLRLAQAATARNSTRVLEEDFAVAINRLLDDAASSVVALYARLTAHGQDIEMVQALRRIATAPQDPWGRLLVTSAAPNMLVGGRPLSAKCWERLQAAGVLQSALPDADLFHFAERGLMHHALLLAARDAVASDLPEAPAPDEPALTPNAGVTRTDAPTPPLAGRTPLIPRQHRTRHPSMSSG